MGVRTADNKVESKRCGAWTTYCVMAVRQIAYVLVVPGLASAPKFLQSKGVPVLTYASSESHRNVLVPSPYVPGMTVRATERLLAHSDKTRELLETDHCAGGVNTILTVTHRPITCRGVSDEFQSMSLQNVEICADDRLRHVPTMHRPPVGPPAIPTFANMTRRRHRAWAVNALILDPRMRDR